MGTGRAALLLGFTVTAVSGVSLAQSKEALVARARSTVELALAKYRSGEINNALSLFRDGAGLLERAYGDQASLALANAKTGIGRCLRALGRFKEARTEFEAALSQAKGHFRNRRSPILMTAHTDLASCLNRLGLARRAKTHYERALQIAVLLSASPLIRARCRNNLAHCLRSLGNEAEALAEYDRAWSTLKIAGTPLAQLHATILGNRASCLSRLGQLDRATLAYVAAIGHAGRLREPDPRLVASLENNFGAHLFARGRYAQAMIRFRSARQIHDESKAPSKAISVARSYHNEATCLREIGYPYRALEAYNEALRIKNQVFGGDHPATARTLASLGTTYSILGKRVDALRYYKRAYEMRSRIYSKQPHADLAESIGALGSCLFDAGSTKEATKRCQDAWKMIRSLFAAPHALRVASRNNYAMCLSPAEARREYEAALAEARTLGGVHVMVPATNLGRLLLNDLKEPLAATVVFKEGVLAADFAWSAAGGHEIDRFRYAGALGRVDPHSGLARASFAIHKPTAALAALEAGRARTLRLLLETGNRNETDASRGSGQFLASLLSPQAHQAKAIVARLSKELAEAQQAVADATIKKSSDLPKLRAEYLRIRRALFAIVSKKGVPGLSIEGVAELQQRFGRQDCALVYAITACDSFVVQVGRNQIRKFDLAWPSGDPVCRQTLSMEVRRYVASMRRSKSAPLAASSSGFWGIQRSRATGDHRGYKLFRALLPSELWRSIQKSRTVHIVPDGELYRLPFETLITEQCSAKRQASKRSYWIDSGPPIAYSASLSVLSEISKRVRRSVQQGGERPGQRLLVPCSRRDLVLFPKYGSNTDMQSRGRAKCVCMCETSRRVKADD